MDIKNIYYIAGILEGESYMGFSSNSPRIYIGMRDEDIIAKLRNLIAPQAKIGIVKGKKNNHNSIYCFNVTGISAIQWMMTIYSLMGRRRKEQIRDALFRWNKYDEKTILIMSMAKSKKINYVEAKEMLNNLMIN